PGTGPCSYTWMPSGQTGSVATNLSPGTYTLSIYDAFFNLTYTATTSFNSLIPLSGSLSATGTLNCNGAYTGTAAYTNISGGSGTQSYLWTSGTTSLTVANPTVLSVGL